MKRRAIFVIPLTVLALAAGIFIEGCRSRRDYHEFSEKSADRVVEKMSDDLDLTQAQKATLDGIKRDILGKREQIKNLRSGLLNELIEQMKSEGFSEEKLNQSFQQREASFKELRTFFVSKLGEFHAVMTPEQRSKLAERLSKHSR